MARHIGTQSIETERLLLRKHEMRDAEDIFRNWAADPEANRFWSWDLHRDIEETRGILREWVAGYENPETYHWIITLKESGEAVGYIYLRIDEENNDQASVHFLLARRLWNQGFMTEACRAVLAYGFERIGLREISSWHHEKNPASGRVMSKAGFRCVGSEYRAWPDCPRIDGEYPLYTLPRWEWLALHSETARWMRRNARPLDYARWRYHFEGGSREDVLETLLAYQNPDGGFGHAVEADAWNPASAPIQTWAAAEILREIGMEDTAHPVIRGIVRYLASGKDFDGCVWTSSVPGNNDHPHAPWWTYDPNGEREYNPTAYLAGFLLKFAEKENKAHTLGRRVAREAAQAYLLRKEPVVGHLAMCYVRLTQFTREAGETGLYDIAALEKRLHADVAKDLAAADLEWMVDGVLLEFIKAGIGLNENPGFAERVRDHLLESRLSDGTWNVPWSWGEYPEEWAVAKNWWKAYGIIANLLFIMRFDQIQENEGGISNETGR